MMSQTNDFDAWYRQEHKRVLGAVTMMCGDDYARAEDAVNDAFVKAYERWDSVGDMDTPGGWVTRVAMNNAKRSLRFRGRRIRKLTAEAPEESSAEERLGHAELWRAVSELPVRQRRALVLRYIDDFTQERIAAEMGVAPGTTAATLHKARNNLRSALDPGDPQ